MGSSSFEITKPRFILTCVHEDTPKVCIMYFVLHAELLNILIDFSTWITYKHLKLTCPIIDFPLKTSLPHFNSNMILFV